MKPCAGCGRSPRDCCCRMPDPPKRCGICSRERDRDFLNWVGKPNPHGAWRGEIFSHWECKDGHATMVKAT